MNIGRPAGGAPSQRSALIYGAVIEFMYARARWCSNELLVEQHLSERTFAVISVLEPIARLTKVPDQVMVNYYQWAGVPIYEEVMDQLKPQPLFRCWRQRRGADDLWVTAASAAAQHP